MDPSNETRAINDYPDVMDSAVHMLTYHVGLKKIRLYRVAGCTDNHEADSYQLSHFENVLKLYNEGSVNEANELALAYIKKYPENISCHSLVAEGAVQNNYLDIAHGAFKKAVEFSPTNYHLNARLAKFLKDQYEVSGDQRLLDESLYYFEQAIKYAENVAKIKRTYYELKESGPWQLKNDTIAPMLIGTDSLSPQ